jgi:hypothetical protein
LLRTAVIAVALGIPGSAAAQAKFELVPYFGSYYALANFLDEDVAVAGGGTVHVTQKQSPAPSIGGKLRYWMSSMWGLEGAVNYAWTGIQTAFPDEPGATGQGKLSGTMLTATGRILYRPRRSNVYLLAGAGYIEVGGDAWNDDVNNDGIKDFDVTKGNFHRGSRCRGPGSGRAQVRDRRRGRIQFVLGGPDRSGGREYQS